MRKGSFRETNKPIISLRNLSEHGSVKVPLSEYRPADPKPDSWVMIKPGDVIISQSGTIRLILRKDWQAGEVESLRITYDESAERLEASLEVERMEIGTSNFDFLSQALRATNPDLLDELRPEYFSRTMRFNILTLLGFGRVGYEIAQKLPSAKEAGSPDEHRLRLAVDTEANVFHSLIPEDPETKLNEKLGEFKLKWSKRKEPYIYLISEIGYSPGVNAATLETMLLSAEVSNTLALARTFKI